MTTTDDQPRRAKVPADIGTPDRVAFGLTFRQLAILGGTGLGAAMLYRSYGPLLPSWVWLAVGIPVIAFAFAIALGRRDGLPLDVWLRHAFTLSRAPRTLAPGQSRATSLAAVADKPVLPAPLRLPLSAISPQGTVTAEGAEHTVIACGTTSVHLRTGDEQASLLDGFGRFLNSLTGPVQMLVSAHRHDLTPLAQSIADSAARLPHPALQESANGYAEFLLQLDADREPLRRQVLAVVTGAQTGDTATRALSGLGVAAEVLDGPSVTAALAAAVDPFQPPVPGPRAIPGAVLTVRST